MNLRKSVAPSEPRWEDDCARMRGEAQAVAAQLVAADPSRYPTSPPSMQSADDAEQDALRGTWIVCVHERRKRGTGSGELLVQWGGPDLRGPRLTWVEERRVRRIAAPEVEIFDIRATTSSANARSHGKPRLTRDGSTNDSSAGGYQRDSGGRSVGNGDRHLETFTSTCCPRSLWVAVLPAKLSFGDSFAVQHPEN
jgi:hypothetical protein